MPATRILPTPAPVRNRTPNPAMGTPAGPDRSPRTSQHSQVTREAELKRPTAPQQRHGSLSAAGASEAGPAREGWEVEPKRAMAPEARHSFSRHSEPHDSRCCAPPSSHQSRLTSHQSLVASPIPLYYHALLRAHGPQSWWPGRTRFEVIVGAILTQNTSWTNVERAISALRREKLLNPAAIERVSISLVAQLIRSSGYFRQKARKLKEFVSFLRREYQGSLNKLFATPTTQLREQLLAVHGIGPETADSILLYAGQHKVFVVDAYTRRILERHRLIHPRASYEEIAALFERSLPADASLFNEYHALIVHTGKHFCRKRQPDCNHCPLQPFLPPAAPTAEVTP